MIEYLYKFNYGLLVKWLTHHPLKVTFMGSSPIQATKYVYV